MLTRIGFLLPVLLALLAPCPALCETTPEQAKLFQEQMKQRLATAKASVGMTLDCAMDKEIVLDLPTNKAARLKVEKNSFGIAEILLYPEADNDYLYVYAFDTAGTDLNHNPVWYTKMVGRVDQLGYLPVAAIVRCKADGGVLHVNLIISSDKARNRDALEAGMKGEKWGGNTRDASFYLPKRISLEDRVTGFVKFWSEAKYNFPFFERMPELNWDKVFTDYLPRITKAETLPEYDQIMYEVVALLKDGHTRFYGGGFRGGDYRFCAPPIRLRCAGGKAVIEAIDVPFEEAKAEMTAAGLKPGDEIVSIDGFGIADVLQKDIYPYIAASTPQARDLAAYEELLTGPKNSKVTLTVKDAAGAIREVKLTRISWPPPPASKGFVFKDLGDGIGYVNLPSFADKDVAKEFDKLADQLKTLKGLVIDVRENGGGDDRIGNQIISHLIDKPLANSVWKTRDYRPSFRAWKQKEQWFKGEQEQVDPAEVKYFLGPIVLLTSATTCSAAEDFTVALHAGKRVTVVGEKTNGSTGEMLMIKLPMNRAATICTKWDSYPDGREFVGVGVIPDVEVGPTAADIAAGRDAVLDKGVQVLGGLVASGATATASATK